LGVFLSLLVSGCVEPSDRIQVHSTGEGRVDITRVPKDPVAPPAPSVAAPSAAAAPVAPSPVAAPSPPPTAAVTAPPPEAAAPVTAPSAAVPTDEAAKQRRIEDLQKKVQEINAEIERLKTQPTTAP